MGERIFILGGTRSGKSRHAVRRAAEAGGDLVTFIATALPEYRDPELDARIALHRRSRPEAWPVIVAGADLAEAVGRAPAGHVVLIDSLTLWVSHLLDRGESVDERWRDADAAIAARSTRTVIVSDEIGLGMVPLDAGARAYRDDLGRLHQRVAARADEVWLMVAGLPLAVKR